MPAMFERKTPWIFIFRLVHIFFFYKNLSLVETVNVEAIINIRYEATSNNYVQNVLYSDKYQLFQDAFFNKTTTVIILHYAFNGSDTYIDEMSFLNNQSRFNGTFYSCFYTPTQIIQCLKLPRSLDLLSGQCLNGTGIEWFFKEEYFSSSHFKNSTIHQTNDSMLICYTLIDSDTSTTTKLVTTIPSSPITPPTGTSSSSTSNTTDSVPSTGSLSDQSIGLIVGLLIGAAVVVIVAVSFVVMLRIRKSKTNVRENKEVMISTSPADQNLTNNVPDDKVDTVSGVYNEITDELNNTTGEYNDITEKLNNTTGEYNEITEELNNTTGQYNNAKKFTTSSTQQIYLNEENNTSVNNNNHITSMSDSSYDPVDNFEEYRHQYMSIPNQPNAVNSYDSLDGANNDIHPYLTVDTDNSNVTFELEDNNTQTAVTHV